MANQLYNETLRGLLRRETLKNFSAKYLSRFVKCVTHVFVQQILMILMRSIDRATDVMGDDRSCPQIRLELRHENNRIVFAPTMEEIFETYHDIVTTYENVAQDLIPFEEWMDLKTDDGHIEIRVPDWFVRASREKLQKKLEILFEPLKAYLSKITERFGVVCATDAENRILSSEFDFDVYLDRVRRNDVDLSNVNAMADNLYYDVGELDEKPAKESLKKELTEIGDALTAKLVDHHEEYNRSICVEFENLEARASNVPQDARSLIGLSEYMAYASKTLMKELEGKIERSIRMLSELSSVAALSASHVALNGRTINWLYASRPIFNRSNTSCEAMKSELEDELQRKINDSNVEVDEIFPRLAMLNDMDDANRVREYLQHYDDLMKKVNEVCDKVDAINTEESLFKFPETEFPKVAELKELTVPFYTLNGAISRWQRDKAVWLDGPFEYLNPIDINDKTLRYFAEIARMAKDFKSQIKADIASSKSFKFSGIADDPDPMQQPAPLKLCWQALDDLRSFKEYLPLVSCICNPALEKRHWKEMSAVSGFDLAPNAGTTLRKMIELNLMENIGAYEVISVGANKELNLQRRLFDMIDNFHSISFEMIRDAESDLIVFKNADAIETLLEDHLAKVEEMRCSHFVNPIVSSLMDFFFSLVKIREITKLWDYLQTRKIDVDSIFSFPRIEISLPKESSLYEETNKILSDVRSKIETDPSYDGLKRCPNVLEGLHEANEKMDKVRKGVRDYLDGKRVRFPRFFFLSDTEIQKILFEPADPTKIQVHLNKCFPGIKKLGFDEGKNISCIYGDCGERVRMDSVVSTTDACDSEERWLMDLEDEITEVIYKSIRQNYPRYEKEVSRDWIANVSNMVTICVSRMYWTSEVENCYSNFEASSLKILHEEQKKLLLSLTDELKDRRLTRKDRRILTTLIVVAANHEEIIGSLLKGNVSNARDFEWMAQLRYNWEEDRVKVSMCNTTLDYGYEYDFDQSYVVNTALTDRCFRALMEAYRNRLYGAVIGSTNCGKTETVRSLARALAVQNHVFDVSERFDYDRVSQIFKGLVSSGAWVFLKNFNKLKRGILSTISQTIVNASRLISTRMKFVSFEGTALDFDPNGYVCVIMNVGDLERSDLPSNLRVLFRAVSMTLPDFKKIFEIELFASGFRDGKILASKLTTVHEILAEQLSDASHYEFGMCSMKAMVKAASNWKRKFPDEDERALLFRSLIDVILPKLRDRDIVIFQGIVHDVFPDVKPSSSNHADILNALESVCEAESLLPHDAFKLKVVQIFQSIHAYRSLVLVGDPLVGKTKTLSVLADVLTSLNERGMPIGARVKLEVISPGVLDNDQLFGRYNEKSKSWKDGLFSKVFRAFAEDTTDARKWLIFDGNLKETWTESLYTVLDDNKTLYATSGERIVVPPTLTVFFETADMTRASPAIVSRCGVVYMEARSIGWRPYASSHISRCETYAKYEKILHSMFDWSIDPCLQFLRENYSPSIVAGELHLVVSMLNLFETYAKEALEGDSKERENSDHFVTWMQAALLLSIVWGFGGNLSYEARVKFDAFCASLWSNDRERHPRPEAIKHHDLALPHEGMIQDNFYVFKGAGNWRHWGEVLKSEKVIDAYNFDRTYVPTLDGVKYGSLFLMHVKHRKPFLLRGIAGAGKTVVLQNLLRAKLPEDNYLVNFSSFASLTTPEKAKSLLLSKLNKTKGRCYAPPNDKHCVNFVDDLNLDFQGDFATESALELIRQYHDRKYWYDTNELDKVQVRDVTFVLAGTTGSGKWSICPRFVRHFNVYNYPRLGTNDIHKIFTNVLLHNLKRNLFGTDVTNSATGIVNATVDVYDSMVKILRPVPAKMQYLFDVTDISKVVNGCSLIQKESVETKVTFIRLWAHEISRVFGDRITDKDDEELLFRSVKEAVRKNFKDSFETAFDHLPKFEEKRVTRESFGHLMFCNFMETEKNSKNKKYEEVNCFETLKRRCSFYLSNYNDAFKKNLDIVITRRTIEHLIKISRVLTLPGGNMITLGPARSGNRSITKLAAYMEEENFFEPAVDSYRNINIWKEDIKQVLRECGTLKKGYACYFTDRQLKDAFVRDIDCFLCTGEIPDLFSREEKQSIIEVTRLHAQKGEQNAEISIYAVLDYFAQQCKDNLHLILSFSPINGAIKRYFYLYSKLMKYCAINCHVEWPEDALVEIATAYVEKVDVRESVKTSVIKACLSMYNDTKGNSARYYRETGRTTYVASTAFLHVLKLYVDLMWKKQREITATRKRYLTGLEQLELAARQVERMKDTLTVLKPALELSARQTVATMKEVERENLSVEKATILIKEEEEIANKKAEIAGSLKSECEADLAVAIPILEDAVMALNTLKPTDITLVKAMKNPPDTIKLVMAAVCVMLSIPADRTIDSVSGKKMTDYWAPSKRILGDMNFLQNLKEYDKDDIPAAIMQVVKKTYMTDKSFVPHIVAKASSAAEGLCKWVRAMVSYDEVAKVVAPKKEKLAAAQKECDEAEAFLNEKRRTLVALYARLAALNDGLRDTLKKKLELENEVASCTDKLKKAENLIASLGDEKNRWMRSARNLQLNYDNLAGDMIISCGMIAYMSPYSIDCRDKFLNEWSQLVENLNLPHTKAYDFIDALGVETEVNSWYLCNLSRNRFSTENAIIMKNSKMWPLFIDSENEANCWIRQIEQKNGLKIVKPTDSNYMSIIQCNIENGKPILLENVEEELEIILDPILSKDIYKDEDGWYLNIGRNIVRYSHNFRLYVTTRLLNPRYLHHVYDKLTVIDFSLPNEALQNKLLDIVIAKEKPEFQEKFENLIIQDTIDKKALKLQEDNILSTLSSTNTNILEDEKAIQILDSSKSLSLDIIKKQNETKVIQSEINIFRDTYLQFTKYCAELFSTLNTLPNLDHMYRFSFSWFIQLYTRSIESSNRSVFIEKRLEFLKMSFTRDLHSSVCRSLFEKHKILYSFLLYCKILLYSQQITENEVNFFIFSNEEEPDVDICEAPTWLSVESWRRICHASKTLPIFQELPFHFSSNSLAWKTYCRSESIQNHLIPDPWNGKLTQFQKLILTKIVRPDKIIVHIVQLIEDNMESTSNYSPRVIISQSYAESSCLDPLIIILPSYFSPISLVTDYATTMGYTSKFISLSMGEDQIKIAEALIEQAQREGGWVFLQNCHVVPSWMPRLEKICENCKASNTSLDFRLWLSSCSIEQFPISILQNSIKMAYSDSINLKQNLLKLYRSEPMESKDFFEGCPGKDAVFSKLLYGLCFFHTIANYRKYFGIQGWNVPYDFDHTDFQMSVMQLRYLINENEHVPFDALLYFVGECNYGGKIVDEIDRKRMSCLLSYYCNRNIIYDQRHTFLNDKTMIPQRYEYQDIIRHIESMPTDSPYEIFGSDWNAVTIKDTIITADFQKSMSLMHRIDNLQSEGPTQDEILSIINDIDTKIPDEFKTKCTTIDRLDTFKNPFDRLLIHEIDSIDLTVKEMKDNLNELRSAFRGNVALTQSLEEFSRNIYDGKVPYIWKRIPIGIATERLSTFLRFLLNRIKFVQSWIDNGHPYFVYFDALSSCKRFLSACVLTFAKNHGTPVEEIFLDFEVTSEDEPSDARNESMDVYFIRGLHLVGARWSREKMMLADSSTNVFRCDMPTVRLKFTERERRLIIDSYECPLYTVGTRINSEHSNKRDVKYSKDYVVSIPLRTDRCPAHWTRRGTVLYCHVE